MFKFNFRFKSFLLLAISVACTHVKPPIAPPIESVSVVNGIRVSDPYKWMENLKDPKTMDYITAENVFSNHYLGGLADLKNNLLKEFTERDDFADKWGTNPILIGNYLYYSRIPSGKEYAVHFRKLNMKNAKEEPVLDENSLNKGSSDYHMNIFLASSDNNTFFYCFRLNGDCKLIIKSFDSKTADSIIAPITSAVWALDGKSIVYVKNHKEVFVHRIISPASHDLSIFTENQNDLDVDVYLSTSGKYIFIDAENKESSESYYIPSNLMNTKPTLIDPVKPGRKYFTNHFGSDFFLILSDQESGNRRLFKAKMSHPVSKDWSTVLEGSDSLYIRDYTVLDQKYLLLFETKQLNAKMRLVDLSVGGKDNQITFKEPDGHLEFNYYDRKEDKIVFSFASILTPYTTYDYNINSRSLTISRPPAVKDYQKVNYISELVWAKSGDGKLIPISMIHKNGMKKSEGNNPLYLEVYGNYGENVHGDFDSYKMSLLDRGFYLAVAHVRGGGEFGKKWWDEGKLLNKKNAINDYLACAEFLIVKGYTTKGMITAAGNREGGMIIGAAVNERPELFKSAFLTMPDVDMLSALLDTSVVTCYNQDRWVEFGNPGNKQQVDYLYSYSPYNNIKKQNYPDMLFRLSLKDQPDELCGSLKTVAKLRATAPGKNNFLLLTDDKTLLINYNEKAKEEYWAENWAFILDLYNIKE